MPAVRDPKRNMVDGLIPDHRQKYRESGAELVVGRGRFVGPKIFDVALNTGGTRTLHGETVVINTGLRARIDDAPGRAEARPLVEGVEAMVRDLIHQLDRLSIESLRRLAAATGS